MLIHDFRCPACHAIQYDVLLASGEFPPSCVLCGNEMKIVHLKMPGVIGTETGATWFKPGFDVQAGRVFHDRSEQQAWLAKRGLHEVGPEEFKHSMDAAHSPEPTFDGLHEAAEEAYHEVFVEGKQYNLNHLDKPPDITVPSNREE
jgi:hypothetical protein